MSVRVSKNFNQSSAIKAEEEAPLKVIEKQGIVSILGSGCEKTKAAASLRRTLSADMSSKIWLAQNGFSPMKKIASSEELTISAAAAADHSSSSSSEGEEENEGKDHHELKRPGHDDVWRSIQSQKEKSELQKPQVWTWSSILTPKSEDSSTLPPPYIPPLVKRSESSLSEKSLEICTESLGSETGADGFSSYPPSEVGDAEEEKEDGHQQQQQPKQLQQSQSFEELQFVKYNYSPSRKMAPRSFPPPLPTLARGDGASLHMHCHRQNGRLVLEAVSVPSQNYFHAERQDGRLLLTLVNSPSAQEACNDEMEDEVEEYEQVFDNIEEVDGNEAKFDDGYEEEEQELDDEDEEEEELEGDEEFEKENETRELEYVMEKNSKLANGVINVQKSALMMKKIMGLENKNLTWAPKFNKAVNLIRVEEENELTLLPQSLPPPQRVARLISTAQPATAASFNAYEYFWRQKPPMASIINPIPEKCTALRNNNNKVILASSLKVYEQQNLVLMRGNKADYLVPILRRCKEPRRSLLLWEPYCIATS